MSVEQERLKEILAEAADKNTPVARAAYLDAVCQGDPSLRAEVERLLRAHERAGNFLEQSVVPLEAQTIGAGPGTVIGRYKLLEEIGEGGFGQVFMAQQEQPVHRMVALKIIKAGMDTREIIARFEAERQALALMDHPNIARVLDAGATESGRPYFVMEIVRGMPITEYCDQNQVPTAERLRLFMKVCAAVQHAHQKGIIHRDLKPTNILVTEIDGQPVPKIIDFGVAKALGQKLTEKTLFTSFQQMIGTPAYMSPEQAALSGVDVDTRSDIYSLGVLLYELLTGVTPFDAGTLRDASLDEVRRLIRETEPPKPSTRLRTLGEKLSPVARKRQIEPSALSRLLHGDLDWIVMKALEKDRSRRYETANALAEDIEHHLSHRPVRASPPRTAYRMRKFVRRYRMGVAVTGTVTLALVAGLLLATAGFIRASRERNRALNAERLAETHRRQSEATLRRLEIRRAQEFFAQDQAASGVSLLALLLRQDPTDRTVAERLMNELTLRTFPLPVTLPLQHEDGVHLAAFSPDGRHILTASRNNQARIWDAQSARPVTPPLTHDSTRTRGSDFQGGLHPLHAAFSPDGRRVATGATDNTARIWDAATGEPLTPPLPHSNWVTYVAFSPDSQTLATACKDGSTRLWNASDGAPICPPLRHTDWVNFVKFSPDGHFLVTGSDDKTAQIWEVASAKPSGPALRHDRAVRDAAFSPDGRRLITASEDATARLWDARTGEPTGPPMRHDGLVFVACFSPDGTLAATASADKTARLWDGYDGSPVALPLKHQDVVRSVSFSPEGQRVVTASQDHTARVWDAYSGDPLIEPIRHSGPVWSAEFSTDARRVLTASSDQTARLWDVRPGQALGHILPFEQAVHSAQWSPDGRRVLAFTLTQLRVWDPNTGRPEARVDHASYQLRFLCAQFSPDGQRIVTGHEDGTARVWDGWGLRVLTRRMRHAGSVYDAEFSPDGRLIATASGDGTARLWDSEVSAPHGPPLRHKDAVLMARFSKDGTKLATASADNTAQIWSVASGQPLTPPLTHAGQVIGVQFSPDSQWVVTASRDHTAQVWEVASGKPLAPPLTHQAPLCSAQFSPDGQWVVTASEDATAQAWETRTGRPVGEPLTHKAKVTRATFCPEGKRILTASSDGTVGLWEARTGMPLASPLRHGSFVVEQAEFSPDGRWVATACNDGYVKIWSIAKAASVPPVWLPQLAEAAVGERLSPERMSKVVPPSEFFRLKERMAATNAADESASWARWFLADRSTRPVAPGVERTVPEHVHDLLDPCRLLLPPWLYWPDYPERLAKAARLDPTNALVFAEKACLIGHEPLLDEGVRISRYQITNPVCQLPPLDWLTQRAVSLGPRQTRSWAARAMYLALAGQTNAALAAFERGRSFAARDPLFWFAWAKLLERTGPSEAWLRAFTTGVAVVKTTLPESLWLDAAWNGRYRFTGGVMSEQHVAAVSGLCLDLALRVAPRAQDCPPGLIDLARSSSLDPNSGFSLDSCWLGRELTRLDLRTLPHGRTVLGGVEFDARVVRGWASSPRDWGHKAITFPIKQSCRRLHFLHATDLPEPEGSPVAAYVIHYADGQQLAIPVLYGRDIQAWLLEEDPPTKVQPPIAWRTNAGGGITLQLCRFTWENPRPDVVIKNLDFASKETKAAPFLVAITADR